MIRVYHKDTKERFWIRDADKPKMGTEEKLHVFPEYPGCRPLPNGGFACTARWRAAKKRRIFIGTFIRRLPQRSLNKENREEHAELVKLIEEMEGGKK